MNWRPWAAGLFAGTFALTTAFGAGLVYSELQDNPAPTTPPDWSLPHGPGLTAPSTPSPSEGGDEPTHRADTPLNPSKLPKASEDAQTGDILSHFTTAFPPSQYRNTNLGRAAQEIDGTLIAPGEVFSFNAVVGPRTAERGFVKGYVIQGGAEILSMGGGMCQVATTVWNAAMEAGMTNITRYPHSFYISRYPIGRDAAVTSSTDMRFRNDSDHPVTVHAWIDPSTTASNGIMHARLRGTPTYRVEWKTNTPYDYVNPAVQYKPRGQGWYPMTGWRGFSIDVVRKVYQNSDGTLVRVDRLHSTYGPADTVILGPSPSPTPKPSKPRQIEKPPSDVRTPTQTPR